MANVFMTLLNMSLTASYVILVVFLVRLLLKRMPKIFSYALWAVVLFRLIFPFSFESAFSLIPKGAASLNHSMIHNQVSPIGLNSSMIDQDMVNAVDKSAGQVIGNFMSAPTISTSLSNMDKWIDFSAVLWVIGLVLLITYSFFMMVRLSMRLKSAQLIDDHIYEVRGFNTAFVFGFIRPKIYLPTNLSENEKTYIIAHEQTHIQRFDHLIKPFAFLVLTVHWFNPLVWLAFYLMSADMELSCDERVLKKMGSKIKKEYSTSLLSLSIRRRILGGCPLAFGENNTKGRILNILNYRKPTVWLLTVAVIIVAVSALGLISNPAKPAEIPENHFMGYISNFQISENGLVTFDLEKVEWLTLEDTKRLGELNIDPNDLPNGFYIHKPQSQPLSLQMAKNGGYQIIEWGSEVTHQSVSREKFMDHLAGYGDAPPPFRIVIKSGYVQSITEQYLP